MKARKGVIPPHLRRFLFKKGHRKVARHARVKRVATRAKKVRRRRVNPLQAGVMPLHLIARNGKKTLHFDGTKFTDQGRPLSFWSRAQAATLGRKLIARYPALRGWDVLVRDPTEK